MTNINPELVLSVTIGKKAKTPHTLTCALADLPDNALERLLAYGFQRFINDPIGAGDLSVEDRVAAARKAIENLKNGIVGRIRGVTVDTLTVYALREVRKRFKIKNPDRAKEIAKLSVKEQTKEYGAMLERARTQKPEIYEEIMAVARAAQQAAIEEQERLAGAVTEDNDFDL